MKRFPFDGKPVEHQDGKEVVASNAEESRNNQ